MIHVYTGRDEMDAHFVKGLLQQEGIEAIVQGEALQEAWGELPLTMESLPSVWVPDGEAERAMPIVAEYNRRDRSDADTGERPSRPRWTCPNCGERVEEQFTQCWHCGHNRPASGTALA